MTLPSNYLKSNSFQLIQLGHCGIHGPLVTRYVTLELNIETDNVQVATLWEPSTNRLRHLNVAESEIAPVIRVSNRIAIRILAAVRTNVMKSKSYGNTSYQGIISKAFEYVSFIFQPLTSLISTDPNVQLQCPCTTQKQWRSNLPTTH